MRFSTAIQRRHSRLGRAAFTLLELTVATIMLGALLVTATQMLRVISSQQKAAERRVVALQAVQAIAEQIGNMPWDEITSQHSETLALPKSVESLLPAAELTTAVEFEDLETVTAKRVALTLGWNGPHGQPAAPVRLTTWVFPPQTNM